MEALASIGETWEQIPILAQEKLGILGFHSQTFPLSLVGLVCRRLPKPWINLAQRVGLPHVLKKNHRVTRKKSTFEWLKLVQIYQLSDEFSITYGLWHVQKITNTTL